jgi:hypothetical protein
MIKKILLLLLAALVIIQFIHPPKNQTKEKQPAYVGTAFSVPDDVKLILEKACNDCHSNNTRYPWYSRLQPVDWWLTNHVKEGKMELNLDEFTSRRLRTQYHKFEEIADQVKNNEMPLDSYTWIHKDAVLDETEKKTLISWAHACMDSMKARYPPDSLLRKRG